AIQVYYSPYPGRQKDKVGWLVVIKTKPRGVVDDRHNLEVAYQMHESQVNATIEDDPIEHLRDDEIDGENDFIDDELEKEDDFMNDEDDAFVDKEEDDDFINDNEEDDDFIDDNEDEED
ncbi:hypothetical protein CR513_23175, partial [Mucuna pruriens]